MQSRVDGSEADGEWSEGTEDSDSDEKTLSASEQDLEESARMMKHDKMPCITIAHVNLPHGHLGHDSVDYVLDKIDAEWLNMTTVQRPLSLKKRLSKKERIRLQKQGVEFDTGDDTSAMETRLLLRDGLAKLHSNNISAMEKVLDIDKDSGLADGGASDDLPQAKIVGKADVYGGDTSDDDDLQQTKSVTYVDLDSDVAKQLEEQYKLIMRAKWGIAADEKNSPRGCQSNTDAASSVRTEDFETQFVRLMPRYPDQPLPRKVTDRKQFVYSAMDADSVHTEELEAEFKRSLIKSTHNTDSSGSASKGKPPRGPMKGSANGGSIGRSKIASRSIPSDLESVRTEDFEKQFHNIMVKHIASVPITSFDHLMVDSDLDTVKSHIIHERFQSALDKTLTEDDGSSTEGGESSHLDMSGFDNRLLDMIKMAYYKPKDAAGPHQSTPRRYLGNGTSTENGSEEQFHPTSKTPKGKHTSKKSSYSRQKGTVSREGKESGSEFGQEGEAEEMARESAQVRRELERMFDTDRVKAAWRQTAAPKKAKLPQSVAMPTTSAEAVLQRQNQQMEAMEHLQRQFVGLTLSVQTARKDKQMIEATVKKLQELMRESRAEIKNTERQLKENRTGAEDARMELMLTEFKRDSARKELEGLVEQLQAKQCELETLHEHQAEPQDRNSGATLQLQQELTKVTEERDKIQASLMEREKEVRELTKQLTLLKDTMAAEQRKSRSKIDALTEDVEREQTQLEEAQGEKEAAREKLGKLEKKYRHLEKDKNQLVKDHQAECEEMKTELQAELAETRSSLNQQLTKLNTKLAEATTKLTTVQVETDRKEELILQLREHVLELEHAVAREQERREAAIEEMKRTTAELTSDKEQAMGRLREAEGLEKTKSLEALEASLRQQQSQQLRQLETQLKQQLTEQQGRLTAHQVEVEVLKDRLKEQDAAIQDKVKAACKDTQATMQCVLEEERRRWEMERCDEVKRLRVELEQGVDRAREETGRERDLVEKHLLQISQLKKELEETRSHARQAYREKMTAVNVAKESAELEKERELDLLREGIEKETHRSIEHLRETIKHQEAEIQQLRSERYSLKSREEETVATSDRHDKKVISDLNDECRSIVELLGQLPRKVTFSSYNGWSPCRPVGYLRSSIRPTTSLTAAMSSLRSLGEEMRQRMQAMSEQLEEQKQNLTKLDNDKKEELEALKRKMQTEKLEALEMLKDRLIKEHLDEVDKLHRMLGKGKTVSKTLRDRDNELQEIQRNMSSWKASTVEKLAKKFHEEMARELEKRGKDTNKNRAEWEHEREGMKRETERLKHELLRLSMAYNNGPTEESPETAQLLRQLQGKVKILQMENANLKRAGRLSVSVPDLSANCQNMPERSMRQYELRAEEAEGRAKMAEDRAEQNSHILNQKMLEISKLQSTLTQQTKELMQLERAYAQLQQRLCRPSSHTAVYVR